MVDRYNRPPIWPPWAVPDCPPKMKILLSPVAALLVTCVTVIPAQSEEVRGDAKAGEKKIALCIGCHGISGYRASFPEVYSVPMISGQGARYIVSALAAYTSGARKHPTMRGVVANLSEQDIADVAAHYEVSGKLVRATAPKKLVDGNSPAAVLLKKGACMSCHGESLSKPLEPGYPKIAGQHADYLFVALKSYKAEGHPTWGRANPIMGAVARQFSNVELKELADYVGALPGELSTLAQPGFK